MNTGGQSLKKEREFDKTSVQLAGEMLGIEVFLQVGKAIPPSQETEMPTAERHDVAQ